MPFGDYTAKDDSVVARLDFDIPDDSEKVLSSLSGLVETLKTNLEATARYQKEYLSYLKEIPAIQREINQVHQDGQRQLQQANPQAVIPGVNAPAQENLPAQAVFGNRGAGGSRMGTRDFIPALIGGEVGEHGAERLEQRQAQHQLISLEAQDAADLHRRRTSEYQAQSEYGTAIIGHPQAQVQGRSALYTTPTPQAEGQTQGRIAPNQEGQGGATSQPRAQHERAPAPTGQVQESGAAARGTIDPTTQGTASPAATSSPAPQQVVPPAAVSQPRTQAEAIETAAGIAALREREQGGTATTPTPQTETYPAQHPSGDGQGGGGAGSNQPTAQPEQYAQQAGTGPSTAQPPPLQRSAYQPPPGQGQGAQGPIPSGNRQGLPNPNAAIPYQGDGGQQQQNQNQPQDQPEKEQPEKAVPGEEGEAGKGVKGIGERSIGRGLMEGALGYELGKHGARGPQGGGEGQHLLHGAPRGMEYGEPTVTPTRKMTDLMNRRAELENLSKQSPQSIPEMLKARGFYSEGVENGMPKQYFTLGGKKVEAHKVMSDPNIHAQALDELAKDVGGESGSLAERSSKVMGGVVREAMAGLGPGHSMIGGLVGAIKGAKGTGIGRIAGMAGAALPAVGAITTAFGVASEANEMYQQYNKMGQMRGGGAGEGIGYEMQIRSMALSPFLSTEQARQIVMAGLQEGYHGNTLDTVTQFMAQNLKDMNLQVSDSVKLLDNNVKAGGQSIGSLSAQLGSLKGMAPGSNTSFQSMFQQYQKGSQALIGQGAGGAAAGVTGIQEAALFQKDFQGRDNPLKGQGANITTAMLSNPYVQMQLAEQRGKGEAYFTMPDRLSQDGTAVSATEGLAKKYAVQYNKMGVYGQQAFMQQMNSMGVQMNQEQASAYMSQLIHGNPAKDAQNYVKHQTESKPSHHSFWDDVGSFFTSAGDSVVAGGDIVSGNFPGAVNASAASTRAGQANDSTTGAYSNPALTRYIKAYGDSGMQVVEPGGKHHQLGADDFNSKKVMDAIASGKYLLKPGDHGATPTSLTNLNSFGPGAAGIGGNRGQNAPGSFTGAVTLGLTPDAAKLVTPLGGPNIPLTSNAAQSYQGWSGATVNNPPPGNK